VEVGDTLEDFSFQGYRAPDVDRSLEEIRFGDFYDPDESQGIRVLLVNTAAAWCQPCQIEHSDLPDRVEQLQGQGLRVLSLLFQDPSGDPASVETLDAWTRSFETNFPMAIDPSYQMGRYGPAETPPLNLVVDPKDMTLIATFIGNQEGPMWDLIEAELRERNEE
jgi:peroxiredoxin